MRKYDLSGTQVFLHKEGEPLCDANIVDRLSMARKLLPSAREVGISTNGMLLTKQISKDLVSSGMDVVFFSIDGTSSGSYEKVRRNCRYDVVERNVRFFLEKRNESGREIRVVMQMLLTDWNRNERSTFIEKWNSYGVEFFFKDVHCYLDGEMSSFECPDFTRQVCCCQDPFRVLVYHVDGRVGLCCWDYDCEYAVGHATESDMMQLFNGARSRFMREKQLALDCKDVVPCSRCGRIFGKDKISEY